MLFIKYGYKILIYFGNYLFFHKVFHRKIANLEAELVETVGELDKSRHLLITQVKINADYKKEVNLIQNKMEENKAEYDTKMLEYAQLLDLRAARIKVNLLFSFFSLSISSWHHGDLSLRWNFSLAD